jgi:hypothetical protein
VNPDFYPYVAIVLGASLPTQVFRWLGVLFAGRLDDSGEVFTFVKAVATALVAAVISDLILNPAGALATTPVALRAGAAAAGFCAYFFGGRRLALGVLAAEAVLIGGWLALR